MNEQELEKFVEDQYKTWCDNNDISKVEDIDQKDLKEAIEKDLVRKVDRGTRKIQNSRNK